jgi:hypothetical protein
VDSTTSLPVAASSRASAIQSGRRSSLRRAQTVSPTYRMSSGASAIVA